MQQLVTLEYGYYYHIYHRGNNGENIFVEDRNYAYFLRQYGKYILPIAETFAYCLLRNHFHVLVRIKGEAEQTDVAERGGLDPTQQFSNFFNSYAKAINRAYNRSGSLFQKHFGRKLVLSERYFMQLILYIHRNPQRHNFVPDFRTYHYSSYQAIRQQTPSRVAVQQALAWFGDVNTFDQLHGTEPDLDLIYPLVEDDLFW